MQPPQVPSAGTTPSSVGTYSLFNGIAHQDNSSIRGPWGAGLGSAEMIKPRGLCNPCKLWALCCLWRVSRSLPRQDPGTTSTPIGQNNKEQRHLNFRGTSDGRQAWTMALSAILRLILSIGLLLLWGALPPRPAFLLDPGLCPSGNVSNEPQDLLKLLQGTRWKGHQEVESQGVG